MKTKPHNIAAITVEPDTDGVKFKLRIKLTDGGEMVINGRDAIPVFYTVSDIAMEQYNDEGTIH